MAEGGGPVVVWLPPGFGGVQAVAAAAPTAVVRPLTPGEADASASAGRRLVLVDVGDHPRHMPGFEAMAACDFVLDRTDVARVAASLALDEEALDRLVEVTGGWPRFVAAALDALVQHPAGVAGVGQLELIEHSAATEIERCFSAGVPARWRSTVDYLALAGPSSLKELIGEVTTADVIRDLIAAAIVRVKPDVWHDWISLNPLHEAIAGNDLRSRHPEHRMAVLQLAAKLRSTLKVADDGLAAAFELGDQELCAQILDQRSRPFREDELWAVHGALRELPPELLQRYPGAGLHAELRGLFPPGTTKIELPSTPDGLHRLHRSAHGPVTLSRLLLGIEARRSRGKLASAAVVATRGEALADLVLCSEDPAAHVVPALYLQAGIACQLVGDVGASQRLYTKGWRVRAWDGSGSAERGLAARQAVLAAWLGRAQQAVAWIEAATATMPSPDDLRSSASDGAADDIVLARALIAVDDVTAAQVDVWPPTRNASGELWPYRMWLEARYALRSKRAEEIPGIVDRYVDSAPHAPELEGIQAPMRALVLAEAAMAAGNGVAASTALDGCPADFVPAAPAHVRLLLMQSQPEAARDLAASWLLKEKRHLRVRAELLLLHAAAHLMLGETDAAAACISRWDVLVTELAGPATLLTLPDFVREEVLHLLPRPAAHVVPVQTSAFPESVVSVDLTQRELDVLRLLAKYLTYDEIATRLFVTRNTIKTQVRRTYAKLGVGSRQEAVSRATQLGLLTEDEA